MAVVVVGGHSRNVGKTSVVAGLISRLREYNWTALKITQYGHGICSKNGQPCDCVRADHSWAITEEKDRSGESDTSRFLVAGAERAWWVRTQQGRLDEAMPTLHRRLEGTGNVIFESNSVLRFIQPDLYLTVLDPGNADFKPSAEKFLSRANAVILHSSPLSRYPDWDHVSLTAITNVPKFEITPPEYVTPELAEFVRGKIAFSRL